MKIHCNNGRNILKIFRGRRGIGLHLLEANVHNINRLDKWNFEVKPFPERHIAKSRYLIKNNAALSRANGLKGVKQQQQRKDGNHSDANALG
jgi:hypothetical protein